MRIRLLIISVFCSLCLSINAQQWNTVGDAQFENGIHVRDFMQLGDSLYILGYYDGINGVESNSLCTWDGTEFNSFNAAGNGRVLSYYQNELYIGGNSFNWIFGSGHVAIIAHNGEEWYSPGGGGIHVTDNMDDLIVYNNLLIACGGFSVGDLENRTIATWDGSQWLDHGQVNGWSADCLEIYNDELYVGGAFASTSSGDIALSIAKYGGGTNWHGVGGGVAGDVYTMLADSVNNLLYIGGSFASVSNGEVPAEFVASWDGVSWHSVGTIGFSGPVRKLAIYHGQLYAAGTFTALSDGTPINYISRFDGVNWQSVGGGLDFPSSIYTMEVFQDELYIGGNFTSVGGIAVDNIACWYLHPDSVTWGVPDTTIDIVEQEIVNSSLRLYPNPNNGQFYVDLDGTSTTSGSILITDMKGRQEHFEALQGRHKISIDISHLSSGVYLCSWVDGGALRETVRFVVE